MGQIFDHIDILYIFMCNIITYLIIQWIPKDLGTWMKRLISTVVAVGLGALGIFVLDHSAEAIFCSFFIQFLMYDYVIKWFLKKISSSSSSQE